MRWFLKAVLISLAVTLCGCSFSVPDEGSSADIKSEGTAGAAGSAKSAQLTGSIGFSGAMPSSFTDASFLQEGSRAAFPQITESTLVYTVTAVNGSDASQTVAVSSSGTTSANGSVTLGTDGISYSIALPSGTWSISATASNASGTILLKTADSVEVTMTGSDVTAAPLVLCYASSSSTGKGSLNLEISWDGPSGINSVKMTGGLGDKSSNASPLVLSGSCEPGSYEVEFTFYSGTGGTGKVLYRINEIVNVYSNLTTDAFEQTDSGYVEANGKIKITKPLVESSALTKIYVSSAGSSDGTGSAFNPVQTLAQAVALVNNSSAAAIKFEIVIQDDVSLGNDVTLSSGKKVSIVSEDDSSPATVSGAGNSLTIAGEAEISYVNFDGLAGISVYGFGTEKLTINNSTISNGSSSYGGGGIYVKSGAELTSEEGLVIKDCRSTGSGSYGFGGGIFNSGTASLKGVTITGCTAAEGGSAICNTVGASLTLDGETSIDGAIYLQSSASPIKIGSGEFSIPDGDAPITVELNLGTTAFTTGSTVISFAGANGETQTEYFTLADGDDYEGYTLTYNSTTGKAVLGQGETSAIYVKSTGSDAAGTTGSKTDPFKTLSAACLKATALYNSGIFDADNPAAIILLSDITETDSTIIEETPNLVIKSDDASGSGTKYTVTGNSSDSGCVADCPFEIKNVIFKNFEEGFNFDTGDSVEVKLTDCEFKNCSVSGNNMGGAITISAGVTVQMDGVTIDSCSNSSGSGGGIYNAGTLSLTDCTIKDCTSGNMGGGIYIKNGGSLTMSGTEVSGNTAKQGGGIYVESNATAVISSGEISGNTATGTQNLNGGGGIYSNGGTLKISGGAITENSAAKDGGGLYCYGTCTMTGGTISKNTASGRGGAVFVDSASDLRMSGTASIPYGTAKKNDVYILGKVTVEDDLTASDSGATISASSYSAGTQVLFGTAALLAANHDKFAVANDSWSIDGEGKLQAQTVYENQTVPEININDPSKTYVIKGSSPELRIYGTDTGGTYYITLDEVTRTSDQYAAALTITNNTAGTTMTVYITLAGDSSLKSGVNHGGFKLSGSSGATINVIFRTASQGSLSFDAQGTSMADLQVENVTANLSIESGTALTLTK